ncbi:MAG: CapA family protein [Patescibacteria group bacterium]
MYRTPSTFVASLESGTSAPIASSTTPQSFSVLFVGDVMVGRHVELLMDTNGDEYPFTNISGLLQSVDTVVANLEGPVVTNHVRTPSNGFGFTFEKRMPALLAKHNISIVSLANNHTYDQGIEGYNETRSYLEKAGIISVGHPRTISENYVVRTKIKNQPFVFIGFNMTNPSFDYAQATAFTQNFSKNPQDIVVAMIHGGEEYKLVSNTSQQNFYRSLIDAGVTSVIAHHPHVVQEIESYKGKLIFYSLGNFIFDQYFSKDVEQGLAVKMNVTPGTTPNLSFDLIPLQSKRSVQGVMDDTNKKPFLEALAKRSSASLKDQIVSGLLK